MYIKQIYTNCLAQAAYYIESNGEAALIDPLRDPQPYMQLAEYRGARIKYIFETHFHADFVSGHRDLAKLSEAVVVFGPGAKPKYEAMVAENGERFKLGNIWIEVLHTPGHTVESACFLVRNLNMEPTDVFTGDTLFVGDVGRPDLLSGNLGKEELASMLYDSLHNVLMNLPDQVIVYPGHGAGSACGKNIGKETVTTIGEQKRNNYALADIARPDFIKAVTSDLPIPPPYFFKDASINIQGASDYSAVMTNARKALTVEEFKQNVAGGCLVLDTREPDSFGGGFIAGALNIGLNGDFAVWVGTLVPFDTDLVLVCEPGQEEESIMRLARVGYDRVKGFLKGGIPAWVLSGERLEVIPVISSAEVAMRMKTGEDVLLDVRKQNEFQQCKLKNAKSMPLQELSKTMSQLDKKRSYIVCCAGGYRSMIACSMLMAHGIRHVVSLEGGVNKLKSEHYAEMEYAV